MDFQRTERTIDSLKKRSSLTVADILGVVNDVLGDVQGTYGKPLDALDMGEIRAAVTRMSSVGHVLLQINKNKSEEISTLEQRRKKT